MTEHMLDGIDEIVWINLDRSVDRRENMEKIFKTYKCFDGIPITRFPAIDGKTANIDSMISVEKKTITDLEYACSLSHLECIRKVAEGKPDKVVMILEDDITMEFQKYWEKSLRQIMDEVPKDWEIIMLCYISNKIPPDEYTLNKNEYWSTASYIINQRGAKRLMDIMYDPATKKYKFDADKNHEIDQYVNQKVVSYTYKYPMFIYKYGEESTLHGAAIERHNQSRKRIDDMYWWKCFWKWMFYIVVFLVIVVLLICIFMYSKKIGQYGILFPLYIWSFPTPSSNKRKGK